MTRPVLDVPYYAQTSEFTCGPACVLMTLSHFESDPFVLCRVHEFRIWRRTSLVGLGGTDAFGLALPYIDRGYEVRVINERMPTLARARLRSFLTEEDATLAEWSSKEALAEVRGAGAIIEKRAPSLTDIDEGLPQGWVPICLVGMQEVHREEIPHWVVAYGADAEHVFFHDPYPPEGRSGLKRTRDVFQKMLDDSAIIDCSRAMVLVRARRG